MDKIEQIMKNIDRYDCIIALASVVAAQQLYSEFKSASESSAEEFQPISGLTNYTSTLCYMNSLLQLLACIPEYISILSSLSREPNIGPNSTISTLLSILRRINTKCKPGYFFNASVELEKQITSQVQVEKNFFREQQDCSEFWQQINRLLEKEYIVRPKEGFNHASEIVNMDDTVSVDAFNSQKPSTIQYIRWPHTFTTIRKLKCTVCKAAKEDRLEEYQMLSLDYSLKRSAIKTDFEISLGEYFSKEKVNVNCESCTQPKLSDSLSSSPESKLCSVHIKEVQLAKLPQYFCFAINSQIWTQWGGLKSHQKWTYPDKVNLGPYMFYPSSSEVNYQLEALVVHYGESGFGHYFTLRKVDGVWYECNDRVVRKVQSQSGLGVRSPFILMYKRID